jgi:hypothetical protein
MPTPSEVVKEAVAEIVKAVPKKSLGYTTYAAGFVKTGRGVEAVMISEAGASPGGIPNGLLEKLEARLQMAILGCAAPVPGQGTWHMNDAEQQILRTITEADGELAGAKLRAIAANRDICTSCSYTLQQWGLKVSGAVAEAP